MALKDMRFSRHLTDSILNELKDYLNTPYVEGVIKNLRSDRKFKRVNKTLNAFEIEFDAWRGVLEYKTSKIAKQYNKEVVEIKVEVYINFHDNALGIWVSDGENEQALGYTMKFEEQMFDRAKVLRGMFTRILGYTNNDRGKILCVLDGDDRVIKGFNTAEDFEFRYANVGTIMKKGSYYGKLRGERFMKKLDEGAIY